MFAFKIVEFCDETIHIIQYLRPLSCNYNNFVRILSRMIITGALHCLHSTIRPCVWTRLLHQDTAKCRTEKTEKTNRVHRACTMQFAQQLAHVVIRKCACTKECAHIGCTNERERSTEYVIT